MIFLFYEEVSFAGSQGFFLYFCSFCSALYETATGFFYRSSLKYEVPRLAGGMFSRLLRILMKISTATVTT